MNPAIQELLRLLAAAVIKELIAELQEESKSNDGLIEDVLSEKNRSQSL